MNKPWRVLAVVVLYQTRIDQSKTLSSIEGMVPEGITIGIWNNGPSPISPSPYQLLGETLDNTGLGNAYNRSLIYAEQNGFTHILFLDQDTEVPHKFWDIIAEVLDCSPELAVAVPAVYTTTGALLSPMRWAVGRAWPLKSPQIVRSFSVINAGSLYRTTLLRELWGESGVPLFLDYIDHYTTASLRQHCILPTLLPISLTQNYSGEVANSESQYRRNVLFKRDVKIFSNHRGIPILCRFWLFIHSLKLAARFKEWRFLQ